MAALVMVLGGAALAAGGGGIAAMSLFDTSGHRWVRLFGLASAVAAVWGAVLFARGFGFGWVGAP